MNTLVLIAAIAAAAYFGLARNPDAPEPPRSAGNPGAPFVAAENAESTLAHAIANRISNQQVSGQGTVVKILPDDNDGSRHQRFIIRLDSGRTLLVAHNIDLAQRIDSLRTGDTVAFYGVYEWNPKGGVIHWTHHDPQGQHAAGWIKHDGQTYQ